ncbi:MAG: gliding motility-associated C-terminal domain-containing protein [Vicingaceae bacterium]|nr:gliding motility-associated C-terminal domain-containing protein [Vicingaceae bacterium]
MLNINNAVRVSNNGYATIILLSDSTLMAVGDNSAGSLGLGIGVPSSLIPQPIIGLPPIIDIQSDLARNVALTSNGDVYEWGPSSSPIPTLVPGLNNIVAISGCDDGEHWMALDSSKNCYSMTNSLQLVATDVIDIMAGESFSYIVKSDTTLWVDGGLSLGLPILWLDTFELLDLNQVPEACPIVEWRSKSFCPIPEIVVNDSIYFPNVFSPNNDRQNDEFYFPNKGVTEMNWQVYNRWGQLVFETNQIDQSWDGRTNTDSECPEGTYYYILNYKMIDEEWETHKGYITLIR